jgi:thiosulfate/3-mercaptopyruvate sulfurtransferase
MISSDEFPYPLVSTEWLAEHLPAPDLKVIDASWRMPGNPPAILEHEKRRIPGAAFFDIDAIADQSSGLPHMLPSIERFADAVSAMGIGADDRVVVYDDAGIFSAARVWWMFRTMGHERVSVLDGGLPKWLREGQPTADGRTATAAGRYEAKPPRNLSRNAVDVLGLLKSGGGVVLDARPSQRFLGETPEPRQGLRSGHMPGAINLPHGLLLTEEGVMRPLHELARLFHDRDVHAETRVITTCGSGVTAAVISLALERLGHRGHALYDGSWAEWGLDKNDPNRFPVETGR